MKNTTNAIKKFLNTPSMWLACSNVWSQLLYGIAIVYVARHLSPSEFSDTAIAISVIPFAVAISDWGTNSFYTRELSSGRIDGELWISLFRNQIIIAAFFGMASAAVLSIFIPNALGMCTGLAVFSLQSFQSSQAVLRANSRFRSIALNNACYRTPLLTLPILQNFIPKLLPLAFLGLISIGQILGSIHLWLVTRKTLEIGAIRHRTPISNHWKRSRSMAYIPILTQLKSLDIAIWNAIAGSTITGNYGAVSKWGQPTEILAQAAISVEYIAWSKAKSIREALKLSSSAKFQLLVSLLASTSLAVFGNQLVPLLLGDSYEYAGSILRLVGVASIFSIIGTFLSVLLIAVRLPEYVLRGQVLFLLIQWLTIYLLAAKLNSSLAGPIALIIGSCVSSSYMAWAIIKKMYSTH